MYTSYTIHLDSSYDDAEDSEHCDDDDVDSQSDLVESSDIDEEAISMY